MKPDGYDDCSWVMGFEMCDDGNDDIIFCTEIVYVGDLCTRGDGE